MNLLYSLFLISQINGPDFVPVHTLATVSTNASADAYLWFTSPIETTHEATQADPKILQFTGAPGPHHIFLVTIKNGKRSAKYKKTVIFTNESIPTPTPTPTPITGPLHVSLIYDQDQANPNTASLLANRQIRQTAQNLNMYWRNYDDDSPELAKLHLNEYITSLPTIIVQSNDGTIITQKAAPTTVEETMMLLQQLRDQ